VVCLVGVHLIDVHLMSVHPMGVYLMGIYLTAVHLTDMYLIGVYLIDNRLRGIYFMTCTSLVGEHHGRVPHRYIPHGHATTGFRECSGGQGADTGVDTGAGAVNDTRKSGRARKPKRYN